MATNHPHPCPRSTSTAILSWHFTARCRVSSVINENLFSQTLSLSPWRSKEELGAWSLELGGAAHGKWK